MFKEMRTENCRSVSAGGDRNREIVLELYNNGRLQDRSKQCFQDTFSTRKRASLGVLPGLLA